MKLVEEEEEVQTPANIGNHLRSFGFIRQFVSYVDIYSK